MRNMKLIVILGQTSTGKSDFAVEIAQEIKGLNQSKRLIARTSQSEVLGEIISADSRQVYKGMDLGTGKITKKEMRGIPHHLLDVASPSRVFSVTDFQKKALKKIEEINKRNKIPILCGGTGFYIDAIVNGTIFPKVPPNKVLREKLSRKTASELFEILKKLDKNRAGSIDKNNSVRLIRAIEIAKALGKVPNLKTYTETNSAIAEFVSDSKSVFFSNFEVLKIGLVIPDEVLKERIKVRLLARIKKGMLREMENLHKAGLSWKRMESLGLEYRYGALYLQKIKNLPSQMLQQAKDEMIEKINTKTWHYAKRQKTWFKRDQNTIWINPLKKSDKAKALKEVKKFLKV